MPRPQADTDATREMLLETAEQIIKERGAISFTVSELAAACGMSQSNIYRFFPSKEALWEAMAERWFRELIEIMEDVVNSGDPPRDKMIAFFGRRVDLKRARYAADPALFESYMELGSEHFEVVRGYVDLGDHYLAIIVADAMEDGYFPGLDIDRTVSLINIMMQPFCNPELMMQMLDTLSEEKLEQVVDTILAGLSARPPADETNRPPLSIAH